MKSVFLKNKYISKKPNYFEVLWNASSMRVLMGEDFCQLVYINSLVFFHLKSINCLALLIRDLLRRNALLLTRNVKSSQGI